MRITPQNQWPDAAARAEPSELAEIGPRLHQDGSCRCRPLRGPSNATLVRLSVERIVDLGLRAHGELQ
jgi:hypothetical protein